MKLWQSGWTRERGLALMSLLLFVPNFVLIVGSRDTAFAVGVLGQSALLWALLVCALSRWRVLLWVSLPLLLLVPVESFFIALYGYPSTRHVLALVSETSTREAGEYLSGLWVYLMVGELAMLMAWGILAKFVPDGRVVDLPLQLRTLTLLIVLAITPEVLRAIPAAPLPLRQFSWANTYPVGVGFRLAGFARAAIRTAQARSSIAEHRWGTTTDVTDMDLVFVIGESARPDHWRLAGYPRDTNPRLGARSDVTFMPNLVTPWTLTRFSVPTLIERKDAGNGAVLAEKSIIAAFQEAGYQTYWFANQDGMEEISLHVGEAEHKRSYNLSVGRGDIDAAYDGSMLPDIAAVLAKPGKLKFLVIHTKGSHWDYNLRYPRSFARFLPDRTPSGDSGKYDRRNRELLINAYDNSILYTDKFLADIIEALETRGKPAALVYVSDHGQGLYDGICKSFGQGNDMEVAFRTAGLIWASRTWQANNPVAFSAIQANAKRPLQTAGTVFNTLADFGGLSIADRKLSLLAPDLPEQRRWVNTTGGLVDFDKSARVGACRLITGSIKP